MKRQAFFPIPPALESLLAAVAPLRKEILEHPLYRAIRDEDQVRAFMTHHCFAVWDFMSLLKALQRRLTSTGLPWLPADNSMACRWINEIVLAEESDDDGKGGYLSHFELYQTAMSEAGADLKPLERFLSALREGLSLRHALRSTEVPEGPREFVEATWTVLESESLAGIAAAFTLGRENLVPDMFLRLIAALRDNNPERWERFYFYLERHVQLDGEEHGPMALRLLSECCGENPDHWRGAEQAALLALEARRRLWDAILQSLS